MSAQTRYGYSTPKGPAGGIVDLAPYAVDARLNEAETGVMKFGIGVVKGSQPGVNVNVPATGAAAADFEGITTNNHTTEYDLEGKVHIRKGSSIGIMRYGRIYGRVATGVTPAYGEAVYMVADGDEAGFLTNNAGGVAIKGRFLSGVDATSQVAMIELFNQAQA